MRIKKKDMQNTDWKRLLEKRYISEKVIINNNQGVASLTIMDKVIEPLEVNAPMGKTMIANTNFKWLQIALENQNFWLTAMYDDKDNLIEVYFDITDNNFFDDITNPYCYDLFTDIVLTKDNVYIVDEDELDMAYTEKVITDEQYKKVKETTKKLYDYICKNREEIINYCNEKRKRLEVKLEIDKNLNLFPYTDDYYDFVYETKKNAYKKYVEECWGKWDEEAQKEYFKKFIDKYHNSTYIIKLNDNVVGFYNDEILEDGSYEVGNICIIPEYQGKGIGSKVLIDKLDENKDKDIKIQYFKQNPVGNLYERLGFVSNGETEFHYKMIKKAEKIKTK